jgi:hypothetical protein
VNVAEAYERYREATERARRAIVTLGLPDTGTQALNKLVGKVELFLWHFLRVRWHDAQRFFASIESKEALDLTRERFEVGKVFDFFSQRQDDLEWENCMTVGLCLVFASMRQAIERGFDPHRAGIFTLQRMLEQVAESVSDLEELLARGAPP